MKPGLDDAERMARLRLARSAFVGPATFRDLLQNMPDAVAALAALPELARRGNIKGKLRIASEDEIVNETVALASIGARLIVFGDPDYPTPLAMTDPPPPVISVMGDIKLLNKRALAVVGSRNASAAGAKVAVLAKRALPLSQASRAVSTPQLIAPHSPRAPSPYSAAASTLCIRKKTGLCKKKSACAVC